MSFAALTRRSRGTPSSGADWQRFGLPRILYLDTLILIASSYTLELARKRFAAATLLRSGPSGSQASGDDAVDQAAAPIKRTPTLAISRSPLDYFFVSGGKSWRGCVSHRKDCSSRQASQFISSTCLHGDAWASNIRRSRPRLCWIQAPPQRAQRSNQPGNSGRLLALRRFIMGRSAAGNCESDVVI